MREEEVEIFGPIDQVRVVARKMWNDRKKAKLDFWVFRLAVSKAAGKGLLKYRVEDCWVPDVENYLKDFPELQARVDGHDIDDNSSYQYEVRDGKEFYPDNDYKICNDVKSLLKKLQGLEAIKNTPALSDEIRGILQRIDWVRNPPRFELGDDHIDEIDNSEGIYGDLEPPEE